MGNNPYGNLGGMDLGGAIQQNSGIPSDLVSAAQAMGFMPNPYASPAQQMMDMTRFMSLTKNILDTQLGSPNAAWNKMNPTNPTAAMPLYMRNMYNAYGAMANSPAGMMNMPMGATELFQNGGYTRGGLGSNMSQMLQTYLGQQRPSQQPGQSDIIRAEQGTNNGPGTVGAPGPANQGSGGNGQTNNGQGVQGPTIPVLSGLNDMWRNFPVTGGITSGLEDAVGAAMGRNPGQGSNQSAVTVNTGGGPFARTKEILARNMGANAIPQGVDPNDAMDNIVAGLLNQLGMK